MFDQKPLILGQDDDAVEIFARKSKRARKVSIKISKSKGVELIIPTRVSTKKALQFLYSKESWVLEKAREIHKAKKVVFIEGANVPIGGKMHLIVHSGSLRGVTHIENGRIIVSGPTESIPRKVKSFLKELAKKEITARVEIEALKLGVKYNKITIRDMETRWGSCSGKKNLNFSWRLILAPREILEYIATHEVAHLREMNHSRKFWDIVEKLNPQHLNARKWLKEHGAMLHMYD